ncbi:copper metallochaperone COX17 [Aspergillus clavatus NRRL 1]|uniref:Cytochrome c oxidase copper chaperone Cox17, putative n=1 Tax=Aspergillus clavatus (strain ATCC 1007 / CBS 513.65 / DSM 816 / NCTC 3887 / NRRL 1 / QM 1276 / 107) TaxID=344612 RepID=A1CJN8_ASPCL|nr:cytochrome c oxidase copper chaperone Cox17, putative [Aspergillus clavatus NRRL 1]EAW09362.1 cytochrome c oxidase copper chaperone Cox17, putative [Aspergillus clavatus NRRL 1]
MSWLFGSSSGTAEKASAPAATESTPAEKPKPCCVCKAEKTARDDCMLFSKTDDPTQECKPLIEQYKACMAGYGFKV